MKFLLLIIIFSIPSLSSLGKQNELYYSKKFCVELWSGKAEDPIYENNKKIAFVDCLTDTKAIEFGWADKDVYDNIGQSLYYSSKTGMQPSVVLLVDKDMEKEKIRKSIKKIEDINKAFELNIEIILLEIPEGEIIKVDSNNNLQVKINPEIIYYMHSRLDSRLSYEDKFINNISLKDFKSTEGDQLGYKIVATIKDDLFLIETEWNWLWGDSRYGYFLINLSKEKLTLIDHFITESISDPIKSFKIYDNRITLDIDNSIINLYFK